MVRPMLYGRLGNQLFQKAAAIGYAIRHGAEYDLSGRHLRGVRINENGHQHQDLQFYDNTNIILNGYWQSEKYFVDFRERIVRELGFEWSFNQGWCSVHVRRGDYLNYPDKHPTVTAAYLNKAINLIISQGVSQFMFFSDDIEWCRSYIKTSELDSHITVKYSEYKSPKEDIEIMSGCEHNIISNSSFSWWGAWLNRNPNKIVISPHKNNWFGPGNAHLDASDIIPDSWIQIEY